jgi:hypothetical protein
MIQIAGSVSYFFSPLSVSLSLLSWSFSTVGFGDLFCFPGLSASWCLLDLMSVLNILPSCADIYIYTLYNYIPSYSMLPGIDPVI